MAAPNHVPVASDGVARTRRVRWYRSPAHVPAEWRGERPAEIPPEQPLGTALGVPGPDQGYALLLAERFVDRIHLSEGESASDATEGAVGVALRRAAMFGRAPVIHDLEIGYRVWGFLDESPDAELLELRRSMFEGIHHTAHHYFEGRAVVDAVDDETIRMLPTQVAERYASDWRSIISVPATS